VCEIDPGSAGDGDPHDDPAAALQAGGAVLEAVQAKRARLLAEDLRPPTWGSDPAEVFSGIASPLKGRRNRRSNRMTL